MVDKCHGVLKNPFVNPENVDVVCRQSLGRRVLYIELRNNVVVETSGILRYYGELRVCYLSHQFKGEVLCRAGVELDQPEGKNDGSLEGVRYFMCPPNRGLFCPPYRSFRSNSRVQVYDDSAERPVHVGVPLVGLAKAPRVSGEFGLPSVPPPPAPVPFVPGLGQYTCTGSNCSDAPAGTLAVMSPSGWLAFGLPFTLTAGQCTPTSDGFTWTDGVRWISWRRIG